MKHVKKILLKISRRPSDNVIQMLFDMNQDLVETQFVLPSLGILSEQIAPLNKKKEFFPFLHGDIPRRFGHSRDV